MTQKQFNFLYNQAMRLMKKTKDANHNGRHIQRVVSNALEIKKLLPKIQQKKLDEKILILACAWHDVSYVFYKASIWQYFFESWWCTKISRRYFAKAGLNKKEIDLLCNIIFWHPFADLGIKTRRRSLYHQIVQDADWLDGIHPLREKKADELAKKSLYWKFATKIVKPLIFNFMKKHPEHYLNLPQSLKIKI